MWVVPGPPPCPPPHPPSHPAGQVHDRKMRSDKPIPHDYEVFQMHRARADDEPTGLLGVELEEAHM